MFDALADRLESAWKNLRGQGKISETNVKEAVREVRRALLEADVNLQVVKDFVAEVEQKALGAEVISGVRPDQKAPGADPNPEESPNPLPDGDVGGGALISLAGAERSIRRA